jgi:hypothetical protein
MKKQYVLAVATFLTLGVAQATNLTTGTTTQPASLITLNLTAFGIPITMQVPAGTTAKKVDAEHVKVKGPNFSLDITNFESHGLSAKTMIDNNRELVDSSDKYTINEPLAYRTQAGEYSPGTFAVCVGDPARQHNYLIKPTDHMPDLTTADLDVMFAAARSAKLATGNTPAATPATRKTPVVRK